MGCIEPSATKMLCNFTKQDLREKMAMLIDKEVKILKTREKMLAVVGTIVDEYNENLDKAQFDRQRAEVQRMQRLVERRLITTRAFTAEECLDKPTDIGYSYVKNIMKNKRCSAPEQTMSILGDEHRYHQSVFLNLFDDNRETRLSPDQEEGNPRDVIRDHHYADPALRELQEEMDMFELYSLAYELVYLTLPGCDAAPKATKDDK